MASQRLRDRRTGKAARGHASRRGGGRHRTARWRRVAVAGGARRRPRPPAIVVSTAGSTVEDRVRALQLGVDDWLTKPCHPEEVLARVEAVVRQRRRLQAPDIESFVVGEVEINRALYQAFVRGESLELKRHEYQVWSCSPAPSARSCGGSRLRAGVGQADGPRRPLVDVVIHKLRRKLGQASPRWQYIHTHPAAGYRFAPSSCDTTESGSGPMGDANE